MGAWRPQRGPHVSSLTRAMWVQRMFYGRAGAQQGNVMGSWRLLPPTKAVIEVTYVVIFVRWILKRLYLDFVWKLGS